MLKIIELIEIKNKHLERFRWINEAELLNMENSDFRNLESFYECREHIIATLRQIETSIKNEIDLLDSTFKATTEDKRSIENLLDKKQCLVDEILDQDLRILACIDREKNHLLKQLHQQKSERKAIRSYGQFRQVRHLSHSRIPVKPTGTFGPAAEELIEGENEAAPQVRPTRLKEI